MIRTAPRLLLLLLIASLGALPPGVQAQIVEDTDFVEAHSWRFTNFQTFGDLPWASNLSWDLYRDTFIGIPPTRSVAGSGFDVAFYDAIFERRLTETGNCFGMVLLSHLIQSKGHHLGLCAPIRQYGGDNTDESVDWDGDGNSDGDYTRGPDSARVERVINRMHGHQITLPTLRHLLNIIQQHSNRDGNFAFGQAKKYIEKEGATPISVTSSLSPQDGGHALLAYDTRARRDNNGNVVTRQILVYDPNRPWNTPDSTWYTQGHNVIRVDPSTDRWTFNQGTWSVRILGSGANLATRSGVSDADRVALAGSGDYYRLDTDSTNVQGNDVGWDSDGDGTTDGLWIHLGAQPFDSTAANVGALDSISASNGDTYVTEPRGIYYELDTSRQNPAFNDVPWDSDGDGTPDGWWVRRGPSEFGEGLWWGEPGGGGAGTLANALGAADQHGGNLVVIPTSVTAPKARAPGSLGLNTSKLVNTIVIYGDGASIEDASGPDGSLSNVVPWYPSDAPPNGERYDFGMYMIAGDPNETIDLTVNSGSDGYRLTLAGPNSRMDIQSDAATGTDRLTIEHLGSLRPGLALQSASGAPYRIAFHQQDMTTGFERESRSFVLPEFRPPSEAPVRMAVGDAGTDALSVQSSEVELQYDLTLRRVVGDEVQTLTRRNLQVPAGRQQVIQPEQWEALEENALQIRKQKLVDPTQIDLNEQVDVNQNQ
jgi:hypothetical protein